MQYEFKVLHGTPSEMQLNELGKQGFFIVATGKNPKQTSYGYEACFVILQRPIKENEQ